MGADELSARLWRERRQLDYLLFLLETQLLHLQAGNWHRLNYTADELEKVVESLRFDSLARGVEASALVSEWKAPEQTDLPSIVTLAPSEMWKELLEGHRHALSLLLQGIDDAAQANVSLLASGVGQGRVPAGDELARDDLAYIAREANTRRALAAVKATALPAVREFLSR
ncbi:hypothetical protein AAHB33_15405 [Paenarthrobacter sp. S56]|uniref:hypothetical protein n=1 Tax=Paenarthrobacter sp. S56 TaxID=3138179 RepID=UPI003219553B